MSHNSLEPPGGPQMPVDMDRVRKLIGGSLIWVAAALVVLVVFGLSIIRIGRVTGEEVGILLDRISGKMTVINQPGVRIYNGITGDFYVLEKTLQTLDMTGDKNNLKIKTIDGSDVYVDLKVQYKMDANMADTVIKASGPGDNFKTKWTQHYIRSLARNFLGELTTEEFYDSSKRDAKVVLTHQEANERLSAFGIVIDSIVIPQKPRFYKEYEEIIKKKKLADQAVLEEQSKALAAQQRQQRQLVEETNKKNVAIEQFSGEMRQKIIKAQAAGERVRKEADAYYDRTTIGAEAEFYGSQKEAEGVLALKKAEAKGIEALRAALEGEGGRNMVKLEYARKLRQITITGQPFTLEGRTDRFEHLGAPASRVGSGAAK